MGKKLLIAVILIISLLLSGCIEKPETGVQPVPTPTIKPTESTQEFEVIPKKEFEGTITLSGAFALYPMAARWGEEFMKLHPEVRIEVTAGGSGKGMDDALNGLVDIGMVSRAINSSEIDRGAYPIAVAKGAVIPTINSRNPALKEILSKGIKRKTFVDIYINGSVKTWGEVANRDEITGGIHVYTRNDAAGAAEVWAEYLGRRQENLRGTGVPGDPEVLAAVQKDPLGIGFNNYNYAFDMTTGQPVAGVQVVPIDVNENGIADPEEEIDTREKTIAAVKKGTFPHPPARVEYFITKGKPEGLKAEFIRWVLSDGQKYLEDAGYIPLPGETLENGLRDID